GLAWILARVVFRLVGDLFNVRVLQVGQLVADGGDLVRDVALGRRGGVGDHSAVALVRGRGRTRASCARALSARRRQALVVAAASAGAATAGAALSLIGSARGSVL